MLNKKLTKGALARFEQTTDDETAAFEISKARLVLPPISFLPRTTGEYTIDTNAGDEQVGYVLLQKHWDRKLRPVGYWFRTLSPPEQYYFTTERECLSVVWTTLPLRSYLDDVQFTVQRYHSSFRWIVNLSESMGRLTRWSLRLL